MRAPPWHLVNSDTVEAWPATLLAARGNATARALAGARWVLRRKADGRYLAALSDAGLRPLCPGGLDAPGLDAALHALEGRHERAGLAATLPLDGLDAALDALGLSAGAYAERSGLAPVPEPARLEFAGRDRYRRPLWLLAPAARAWRRLQAAARAEGVALEAISGYRSIAYQLGIFARKRARGLSVDEILAVNAAPGFSEHHAGTALDLGCPGEPPAEASFEATPAHAWLQARAGDFGFRLSYPRDNPHGIVHEPWHWRWHPAPA